MLKTKLNGFEISDGYNLLMLRAEEGDYNEVLNVLNGIKQIDINALNKKGYTALAIAIKNGFADIVELLISRGANVNIRNNSGQSPLFLACWCNYIEIVKLLLKHGVEINTTDQRGWSPLTIAAYHGNVDIVSLLLQHNADTSLKDSFGKKAINRTKDPRIIKMLQNAEGQSGIVHTLPSERVNIGNRSITIPTESNLSMHNSEYKPNSIPSVHEVWEKKFDAVVSPHRNDQQYGSQNGSPIFKTPKGSKTMTSLSNTKSKNRNMSFEGVEVKSSSNQKLSTPGIKVETRQHKESDSIPSPLTVKSSSTRKEIDEYLNNQMTFLSEKIQEAVDQRVAAEIAKQVQDHQLRFKQDFETIIKVKILQSFNNLQVSFNDHLKALLEKLGYNQNVINSAQFSVDSEALLSKGVINEDQMRLQKEKEIKALELKAYKVEKEFVNPKVDINRLLQGGRNGRDRSLSNPHSKSASQSKPQGKNQEQLTKGLKSTTQTLMTYTKDKINKAVQNATKTLHHNLLEEAGRVANTIEEDTKRKMENLLASKFAQLSEFVGNTSISSEDVIEKSISENSSPENKSPEPVSQDQVKYNKELEVDKEKTQEENNSEEECPIVERLRIPNKRYSMFKEMSEKAKENLDSVQEEDDSPKNFENREKEKKEKQIDNTNGSRDLSKSPQQVGRPLLLQPKYDSPSKKDDDRSNNNLTPHSDASGTLSVEFRLEGLKNFYGKQHLDVKSIKSSGSNKGSGPPSLANTGRSQQGQQGPANNIPGHSLSPAPAKGAVIQYEFDE